jgi:Kef-type K+ transport system membrane component KefB
MFIAGMELDLRRFIRTNRFCWYVAVSLLSFAATPVVFVWLGYAVYLGVAVSMISAGIIIPVLRELGMTQTGLGRDIIGVGLTGELLSITMLTGIDIYHTHGLTLSAFAQALKLLLLLGASALFLRLLYIVAWWNPARVQKVMESEDPVEEGIRVVLSIAFAGALIALGSGVEPILGSFMAGLIFGYVFRSKGHFEEKINAVGFGFFVPLFFIGVGAEFNLGLLGSARSFLMGIFLSAMVLASNVFPLLFAPFMKLRLREALGMTLLLSAPLSLLVVSGTLGERMGLLSASMKGELILAALVSGILYPSLFRPLGRGIMASLEEKEAEKA